MRKHQIELYYGWEESECGMFHAFFAGDSESQNLDAETAATRLADMLDISADNKNFNWNHMSISIPEAVVEKIKAEGVEEYLHREESQNG